MSTSIASGPNRHEDTKWIEMIQKILHRRSCHNCNDEDMCESVQWSQYSTTLLSCRIVFEKFPKLAVEAPKHLLRLANVHWLHCVNFANSLNRSRRQACPSVQFHRTSQCSYVDHLFSIFLPCFSTLQCGGWFLDVSHTRREAHLQDVGIGKEIKWSLELQSYQLRTVGIRGGHGLTTLFPRVSSHFK